MSDTKSPSHNLPHMAYLEILEAVLWRGVIPYEPQA
jgi:hypothetical protein